MPRQKDRRMKRAYEYLDSEPCIPCAIIDIILLRPGVFQRDLLRIMDRKFDVDEDDVMDHLWDLIDKEVVVTRDILLDTVLLLGDGYADFSHNCDNGPNVN